MVCRNPTGLCVQDKNSIDTFLLPIIIIMNQCLAAKNPGSVTRLKLYYLYPLSRLENHF